MNYLENTGILLSPLLLVSLIALAVILNRIYFYAKLPKVAQSPILQNMIDIMQNNKNKPKDLRDELSVYLLLDVKKSYDFGIKILRIIATTSPMIGLLGTVIGIIKVFKKIALQNDPISPYLISEGLWNAMLTTAIGLSISLPCLFAAFIFSRISEKRIEFYQNKLNQLSFQIEGVKL